MGSCYKTEKCSEERCDSPKRRIPASLSFFTFVLMSCVFFFSHHQKHQIFGLFLHIRFCSCFPSHASSELYHLLYLRQTIRHECPFDFFPRCKEEVNTRSLWRGWGCSVCGSMSQILNFQGRICFFWRGGEM